MNESMRKLTMMTSHILGDYGQLIGQSLLYASFYSRLLVKSVTLVVHKPERN